MPWPLSQDYNEAIQSPTNFADPDLRRGEVVVNALGLPMPRTGNFADVYQVRGADGSRWAVKCFTREVPGLRDRYHEISKHLRRAKLPFMVDFHYLEQGLRVAGRWYPVVKMQWVEGLTLNQFLEQYLDKPAMLEALRQMWGRLGKYLRAAEVGHCDLQHGNVLLVPAANANAVALKLIDYDGMWVPALAGKKSGELGHPSYQHPQRARDGAYSLEVDRFPLLLVYCAVRAVAVGGRALWQKYDCGDNLLFCESDLCSPRESPLLQELIRLNNLELREWVNHLSRAVYKPLDQVPLLEELVPVVPAPAGARQPAPSAKAAPARTERTNPASGSDAAFAQKASPGDSPFDDFQPPADEARRSTRRGKKGNPALVLRVVVLGLLVGAGVAIPVTMFLLGQSKDPSPKRGEQVAAKMVGATVAWFKENYTPGVDAQFAKNFEASLGETIGENHGFVIWLRPRVVKSGKATALCGWDGDLLVLEMPPEQARNFRADDFVIQRVPYEKQLLKPRQFTLSGLKIDNAANLDPTKKITGSVACQRLAAGEGNFALRLTLVAPKGVTARGLSPLAGPTGKDCGSLPFTIRDIPCPAPDKLAGVLVVFVELVSFPGSNREGTPTVLSNPAGMAIVPPARTQEKPPTTAGQPAKDRPGEEDAGREPAVRELSGHTGAIRAVAFSPDGKTLVPHPSLPQRLAAADEHALALVVEVGPLVDELEVGDREVGPAPLAAGGHWPHLLDPRYPIVGLPLGSRLGSGAGRRQEVGHPPQGLAVLPIVGQQAVLQRRVVSLLPAPPPHDALHPRGAGFRPGEAEIPGDLLQAVAVDREVDVRVDHGQDVAQPRQDQPDFRLPARGLADPAQKRTLVAAVAVQPGVRVAAEDLQQLAEQLRLVGGCVDPERVLLPGRAVLHEHAGELAEAPLGVALQVEEDTAGSGRQLGAAQDVDLLLAQGQGLQGVRMRHLAVLGFACPPGRPEGEGKLRDREEAAAGVVADVGVGQAAEQTQVVLGRGLGQAAIAELADLAVVVEQQPRRGRNACLTRLAQQPPGLRGDARQPGFPLPAALAVEQHAGRRLLALDGAQEDAVDAE
jgi:hypothetical protein